MDELFEKMKKLIAEKLDVEEGKITLEASFRQDLGADSLDTYELVYAIEEEMGISIPDEKANEFGTVRDAYEFILFEKMKKLIADKLGIDEAKITMDSPLDVNSLNKLVNSIEEEIGIRIPDEKVSEFKTVKDAYEFIKSQPK